MKATRSVILGLLLAAAGAAHAEVQQANAPLSVKLDISPQPLGDALNEFARQAGLQLVLYSKISNGLMAPQIVGTLTRESALERLLENTGLKFEYLDADTVGIFPAGSKDRSAIAARPIANASPLSALRLAQAENAAAAPPAEEPQRTTNTASGIEVEEVIVTAQKRIERLQDVPVPVTALSSESLLQSNQLRLQDYFTRIPGLGLQTGGRGEPTISIRGIKAEYGTNPAVGIVIDDVPFGASTGLGGGYTAPDLDPSDLARIEVLRGPQGTLYGASSLGGLLKFVTADPSMESVSGRLHGGLSGARNGDEMGYNARASVNVPVSDTFALRASGFMRRDPGFVDNIRTGEDAVNEGEARGGRLAMLWRPSDTVAVKLGALIQRDEKEGVAVVDVEPGLADLDQNRLPGTGVFERKTQFYTAAVTADLGVADLTSLTGYGIDELQSLLDFSHRGAGLAVPDERKNTKFSQEVRLSFETGPTFEWLLGAFYTHEKTPAQQEIIVLDPATGATVAKALLIPFQMKFDEYAGFADLSLHLTDRFDVQLGARHSHIRQHYIQGLLDPATGLGPIQDGRSTADAFTYMVTPRLKLSPDMMLYARVASGYRSGGPNANGVLGGVPTQYDPDETVTYEIGLKADLLGHALSIDASVYHINWIDLQILVNAPDDVFQYTANASRARSQGVELSLESRPRPGMTLATWIAWNNAELTEDFPPNSFGIRALKGDQLPNSARWSGHFSLEQEFPLGATATGFVGGMLSYVDERPGQYRAGSLAPIAIYPSYVQSDLRAGVRKDQWVIGAFVNNVTDKRGVISGDSVRDTAIVPTQPRTVGVSLTRTF